MAMTGNHHRFNRPILDLSGRNEVLLSLFNYLVFFVCIFCRLSLERLIHHPVPTQRVTEGELFVVAARRSSRKVAPHAERLTWNAIRGACLIGTEKKRDASYTDAHVNEMTTSFQDDKQPARHRRLGRERRIDVWLLLRRGMKYCIVGCFTPVIDRLMLNE
jgi:hypothetical protein